MAKNLLIFGVVTAVAMATGAFLTQQALRSTEPQTKITHKTTSSAELNVVAATIEKGYTTFSAGSDEMAQTNDVPAINAISQVKKWLENHQYQAASRYVDEHHSELTSLELEQIKHLFLDGEPSLTKLSAASNVFDELDVWEALASAAIQQRDWSIGFKAMMRASELENSSAQLEDKLAVLVQITSQLRADMERRGDELGIKDLYQQAYDLHPSYPRFQLELAYAHLRTGDEDSAKQLLTALLYEPELGEIASQALERINNQEPQTPEKPPVASNLQRDDIVVPLQRSGNSFFVNTSVNNRSTRLLLDTGASITALSSNLISRLNLKPTGQVIQLSTANGQRNANLYRTDKLRLGRLQLSGLIIAEIELGNGEYFDGLLGTDALNQVNSDYTYLIDNEENALIFRRR